MRAVGEQVVNAVEIQQRVAVAANHVALKHVFEQRRLLRRILSAAQLEHFGGPVRHGQQIDPILAAEVSASGKRVEEGVLVERGQVVQVVVHDSMGKVERSGIEQPRGTVAGDAAGAGRRRTVAQDVPLVIEHAQEALVPLRRGHREHVAFHGDRLDRPGHRPGRDGIPAGIDDEALSFSDHEEAAWPCDAVLGLHRQRQRRVIEQLAPGGDPQERVAHREDVHVVRDPDGVAKIGTSVGSLSCVPSGPTRKTVHVRASFVVWVNPQKRKFFAS